MWENDQVTPEAPKKIPDWINNLRSQVHILNSEGLIKVIKGPKQWDRLWLEVNGYKFGLCRVYENEWWHFEPLVAPGQQCPALVANATISVN
jgi:D-alanyl-D-alanine carboxypeptidase